MERIYSYIEKMGLLQPQETVIIAVSGGADSMLALNAVYRLREKYHLKLAAVHINHNLRPSASAEAEMVAEACRELSVPCMVYSEDVGKYAKEHHLSLEAAGHEVRYKIFAAETAKISADKLVLGHHLNDQAETVLMHLLKGCGISGLAALPAKQGKIIRPLLALTKEEILQICAREKIAYCTDESNFAPVCLRNKLRLELLPELRAEYNPKLDQALSNLAQLAAEDEEFFAQICAAKYEECVKEEEKGTVLDLNFWHTYPISLKRRLLQILWQRISGEQKLDFAQIEQIIKLAGEEKGNKTMHLPNNWQLSKQYDRLIWAKKCAEEQASFSLSWAEGQEELILPFGRIIRRECAGGDFKLAVNQIAVDKAKLQEPLIVRSRLNGDRMRPLGCGEKKVKDILIDKKIPAALRGSVPIIESGGKILCLGSFALSEEFKVTKETKSMVVFTFCTK